MRFPDVPADFQILSRWSRERSRMNPSFERYIGMDYSGAQTPSSSLKGLRVYTADRLTTPQEVEPPRSPRKLLDTRWHRRVAG